MGEGPFAIEGFVAYATTLDPGFSRRIRGASPETIDVLEALAGAALPASYRAFLAAMGDEDGGLDLTFGGSTRVADVVAFYRKYVVSGRIVLPPGALLIGVGDPPVGDLMLVGRPTGEPAVCLWCDGELTGLHAETLGTLLHRTVFAMYRVQRFPHVALYAAREATPRRAAAAAAALEEGFEPLWFSDAVEFCGERAGGAVLLTQYEARELVVQIAGHDRAAVEATGERFARRLPLTRQPGGGRS
jgi:hypothetical protein